MKSYIIFIAVFSTVLLSRLPFLDNGFGNEQDGWRIAAAARYIGMTGEYQASRLPGFPLIELTCSLVWTHGAWAMNLMTALASAMTVGIFALIAKHYGCKDFIVLALTFAFTPIVYINSTVTMDYLWAMMFLTFCWYAGLKVKPIVAGIFLGLAAGCRITSIAMVLPFTLFFFQKNEWKASSRSVIKFWIAASTGFIIVFLPVFHRYSTRFITDFRRDGILPFIYIVQFLTIEVWGVLGSVAIIIVLILMVMNRKKSFNPSIPTTLAYANIRVWIAVLVLFIVEFSLHPMKGGYLIPAIPFLLLLSGRYLFRHQFLILCGTIICSSFFIAIDSADREWSPEPSSLSMFLHPGGRSIVVDFLRGPIWNDHLRRMNRVNYIRAIVTEGDTISEKSVIVAGSWLPYIVQATPGAPPESEFSDYMLHRNNIQYIDMMNTDLLNRFHRQGLRMYYLSTVEIVNWNACGIDLKKEGARELIPARI